MDGPRAGTAGLPHKGGAPLDFGVVASEDHGEPARGVGEYGLGAAGGSRLTGTEPDGRTIVRIGETTELEEHRDHHGGDRRVRG